MPKNGVRIVVGGEKSDVKKLLLKKCLKNWFWLGKPGCKKLLTEKKWLKNCQGCWGKAGCKINRIKGPRSPFHSFIALFSGKIKLGRHEWKQERLHNKKVSVFKYLRTHFPVFPFIDLLCQHKKKSQEDTYYIDKTS